MEQESGLTPLLRLLIAGASTVVIIGGLKLAAPVFTSIFLALLIAISVAPLLGWLKRMKLPGWLAMVVIVLAVFVFVSFIIVVVVVSAGQLDEKLPVYQSRVDEIKDDISGVLERYGVDAQDVLNLDVFEPNRIINATASIALNVASAMSNWLFVLVIAVFIMIEAGGYPEKLMKAVRSGSPMPERLISLNQDIRSYVLITAWLGLLVAALNTVLLIILGVDFAILWGVLSFLFSFIPVVGFIIALIPPVVLALLESGWGEAVIVLAGYLLINNMVDNVLKPRIMGHGLNLSPLVIILSLFFWAWVFGAVGAILAVPLTMAVKKIVLEGSEDSRWMAVMMEPAGKAEAG
ncbi:MAG: AI-2E family transporter [Gaiellales bacterium]|nr:MAG: AI-2E family transporter [Gaiellales bacterium]